MVVGKFGVLERLAPQRYAERRSGKHGSEKSPELS
jgi:hypothetical protein